MTIACADLDNFFDGELAGDHAAAFRDHVGGCARCQRVLHGRMQEAMVIDAPQDVRAPLASAVRRNRLRVRLLAVAVPLVAAAAVVVVTLTTRTAAQRSTPLRVELAIDHTGPVMRGASAHPNDLLRITARGAQHRAIWVYRDERVLVAVCPGHAACRVDASSIALDFVLAVRGKYAIVTLGAASEPPVPSGTFDTDIDAASTIDGSYQIGHVDVN